MKYLVLAACICFIGIISCLLLKAKLNLIKIETDILEYKIERLKIKLGE